MPAITALDSQIETPSYLKIEKAINYWSQYKPGAGRAAEQCCSDLTVAEAIVAFELMRLSAQGGTLAFGMQSCSNTAQNKVMA